MLRRFHKPDKSAMEARNLYQALVGRAREPVFYQRFSVPDTIDGRFDLLAIHAYLVLDALNPQGAAGSRLASELASIIFAGFDDALRELGVGDFGISRRIKAMASAFYGRLEAYRAADSEAEIAAALIRNLYRGDETREREAAALAHYISSARCALRSQTDALSQGIADFGPLPAL